MPQSASYGVKAWRSVKTGPEDNRHYALAMAGVLLLGSASIASAGIACDPGQVIFDTGSGDPLSILIELADDPAERAQGLMFRRELQPRHGMLFVYEAPQPASFWMRNTLIPLDIVFMDSRGIIRHIHENARPLDETPIPGAAVGDPDPLRLMVLEIGGGEAASLGLKVGQAMSYPALDQTKAAISCD